MKTNRLSITTLTCFAPTPRTGGAVTLHAPKEIRLEAGTDVTIDMGVDVAVAAGAVAVVTRLPAFEAPEGLTVYSTVHWPLTRPRITVRVAAGHAMTIDAGQPIAQLIEADSSAVVDIDAMAKTEPETQPALKFSDEQPADSAPACRVKALSPTAVIPTRGSENAAGLDLYAAESVMLFPGEVVKVPTALAFEIPAGHFGLLATRSSIALKNLTVFTTIVDNDYRGELFITVRNDHLVHAYQVRKGDRLAQLVIVPYSSGHAVPTAELSETARGTGGYGSTGV